MNILVLLHTVRDPNSFMVNRRAQKVFINREHYVLNPADRNALEVALRLAEARRTVSTPGNGHGAHVIALALTTPAQAELAEDTVRQGLSFGAERAVLVQDEMPLNDAGALTTVLQRVVEHLGQIDLVLLGAEVVDRDLAQLGPRLAQALGWPFIAAAHQLTLAENTLNVVAAADRTFRQYEADLPAVVAVAPHSNKPRYATAPAVITTYAKANAVEVLTLSDLGLSDLPATVEWVGEAFPPERELGRKLEGDADEVAKQVVEVLLHH